MLIEITIPMNLRINNSMKYSDMLTLRGKFSIPFIHAIGELKHANPLSLAIFIISGIYAADITRKAIIQEIMLLLIKVRFLPCTVLVMILYVLFFSPLRKYQPYKE